MEEEKQKNLINEISSYKENKDIKTEKEDSINKFEEIKSKFENLKKTILKKFSFTLSLSIIPENALKIFQEDEEIPKEMCEKKPVLFLMVIPEDHYKSIEKIKPEVIKLAKETEENIWVLIKTPVDLWNYGLDSKFELIDAISVSFPIYDKGFLGCLRVANIHKSLVLNKFERYVASYCIGGSLVRGSAGKDSDVDTFVIIDDTDVKRMSRIELLEKLRGIIYDYIKEASVLAGVRNILNVQVYLLTDFWQNVKDAHPVIFTFIRDGIPFYDRGTFIPWKLLLKMGKIKPSPEAVDMFMKSGEQNESLVNRRLIDALIDIYWGVVTPTQALMMLAGEAPPVPKTMASEVKRVLIEREKVMKQKEWEFLEKIVKMYKENEYGKLTKIKGEEIDKLLQQANEYIKEIKKVREKLEKRLLEKTAERVYKETKELLKNIFGDKSDSKLLEEMDAQLIRTGKIPPRMKYIGKEVLGVVKNLDKISESEMHRISRDATDLITTLVEYVQRKELIITEKGIIPIIYDKEKKADIVLTNEGIFITSQEGIKKIEGEKLIDSNKEALEKALQNTKDRLKMKMDVSAFEILKKELGNFVIVF